VAQIAGDLQLSGVYLVVERDGLNDVWDRSEQRASSRETACETGGHDGADRQTLDGGHDSISLQGCRGPF
jgi:hypothetical protein